MASDPLGSLDEFFDFAQLEADIENGLPAVRQPDWPPAEPFPNLGLDHVMDWEPSSLDASDVLAALPTQPLAENRDYTLSEHYWTGPAPLPVSAQHFYSQSELPVNDVSAGMENLLPSPLVSGGVDPVGPIAPRATPAAILPHSLGDVSRSSPSKVQPRASTSTRKPASAKRKGSQARIPLEAKQMMEEEFATNPYPCSWEIDIIAHQANIDAKRVRNWFNNARARKKPAGDEGASLGNPHGSHTLATKLSTESLEALSKQVDDGVAAPQPPLEVYLASSYLEEAAAFTDIQAAIETVPTSERGGTFMDSSSGSRIGKSGSVITSQTSSDGSAPTSFAMSSGESNISSFGRDRRRGRRRMTWRTSPYARAKFDGLDDAGVPARNLPFFCTFCPRAFKTKYEWIRHEDSVHALRTTWICCSTKQGPLQCCPFCGQMQPDEVHMAEHKYQQCRNKPESHRTFYRRDHFIQHLHHVHFANVKHPSAELGCQAHLPAKEGHSFGCKELAMKWRRFGAPMGLNDPMLHCGFCGKKLKDWNARCDHVAEHLIAGGLDRSSWWPERMENHMEHLCVPQTVGPFRCRYCQKVFANANAMNNHSHCRVWSCRFLRTFDDVTSENSGPPLCPQFPSPKAHHCHLCGAGYRSSHIDHAQQYHKYRLCKQELFTSESDFLQHLHDFHAASHPLLLHDNPVLEQHFMRNKGACFEPVDFDEILQGCRVATPTTSFVDPFNVEESAVSMASSEESVDVGAQRPSPPRRTTRDRISDHAKVRQQRCVRKEEPKADPPGPRFFRLDPLVPFLSSRIYYLRNAKMSNLFNDGRALLEEVPHSHIASLVMSSGLVGMAGVRMPAHMKKDDTGGVVEFALDED